MTASSTGSPCWLAEVSLALSSKQVPHENQRAEHTALGWMWKGVFSCFSRPPFLCSLVFLSSSGLTCGVASCLNLTWLLGDYGLHASVFLNWRSPRLETCTCNPLISVAEESLWIWSWHRKTKTLSTLPKILSQLIGNNKKKSCEVTVALQDNKEEKEWLS